MKVRLFDIGVVIGTVAYTDNLDRRNGHNRQNGGTGRHLGIGKLKDGRFYLCHGSQWEGEEDYAEVIGEAEAKRVVLRDNPDLYPGLFGEEVPDLTA